MSRSSVRVGQGAFLLLEGMKQGLDDVLDGSLVNIIQPPAEITAHQTKLCDAAEVGVAGLNKNPSPGRITEALP